MGEEHSFVNSEMTTFSRDIAILDSDPRRAGWCYGEGLPLVYAPGLDSYNCHTDERGR